ncbi:MAG: VOC family protein [Planctomycetota bacterium]|jgi:hypothetical protein
MPAEAHTKPDHHALGEARLEAVAQANSKEDWDRLWKEPARPFPFKWGECWNQCVQYAVKDYAAEVGFFVDALSFPVNTIGPDFTMFTGPKHECFFAVVPASEKNPATPADAVELMFMVEDILDVAKDLERRGVVFDEPPAPYGGEDSPMRLGRFRTPGGIRVALWGMVEAEAG